MGPFLTGGGYAGGATDILFGLYSTNATHVTAYQSGGAIDDAYTEGVPQGAQDIFTEALSPQPHPEAISLCYSLPPEWRPELVNVSVAEFETAEPYQLVSSCPSVGLVDDEWRFAPVSVGRAMLETDRLPRGWAAPLDAMDELWVPSRWQADTLTSSSGASISANKLVVVPEPIDTGFWDPEPYRALLLGLPPEIYLDSEGRPLDEQAAQHHAIVSDGELYKEALVYHGVPERECEEGERPGDSPDCPFRFLTVAALEHRKGWDLLLRAYLSEFARWPSSLAERGAAARYVHLYILTSSDEHNSSESFIRAVDALPGVEDSEERIECGPHDEIAEVRAGRAACAPAGRGIRPPMSVLRRPMKQELLPALYASVDAFVLPSRGEGWGRTLAEAMAMGLPVIATAWGGTNEFLSESVAYPLHTRGTQPVPAAVAGVNLAGHRQAAPDVLHLRRLMRRIVSHRDEAAARGRAGRELMQRYYDSQVVAQFVLHQIDRLTASLARDPVTGRVVGLHDERPQLDGPTVDLGDDDEDDEDELGDGETAAEL